MLKLQEQKKQITSADVAMLAGVHKASVSRALNGGRNVSKQTKQRVLDAVKMLNYRPSSAARMLSRQEHEAIGLLTEIESESMSSYGSTLVQGISKSLTEKGYRLAISAVHWGSTAESIQNLPLFRTASIDGIIFDAHRLEGNLDSLVANLGISAVFVNPINPRSFNTVMPDDVHVAKTATEYLIHYGHKNIAYVPCTSTTHCSQPNRMRGYMDALAGASLIPQPFCRIPNVEKTVGSVYLTFPESSSCLELRNYLKNNEVTGFVTYGVFEAIWLVSSLLQLGFKVPHDVSVIACDFDPVMQFLSVPVTGIYLDRVEMGMIAAEMLIEKKSNGNASIPSIFVKGKLKEGSSVSNIKTL